MLLQPAHSSYRYKAFGLDIASDILLPQLVPSNNISTEPDVTICAGKVPSVIPDVIEKRDTYQLAKNEYMLRVQGVGGYYVTSGNRIIYEPDEQAEEHLVCQYLLNVPIGVLLLQREIVSMHGSAVVVDGYALVFTGVSGAGKSTLAAAFRLRGYPMLTDDVAALILDNDGMAWVQPACPQQNLRRDSAEAVGIAVAPGAGIEAEANGDKFVVLANQGFCQSPVPLGAVYELRVGESCNITVSRLVGAEKLSVLMKNSWAGFIDLLGLNRVHFEQCLKIAASKTPVSRLTKPRGVFSLEEQMRLVEEDLRGDGGNGISNLAR
jgi:hypothetical protein